MTYPCCANGMCPQHRQALWAEGKDVKPCKHGRVRRAGISKAGKAYAMLQCREKSCPVEWVDVSKILKGWENAHE